MTFVENISLNHTHDHGAFCTDYHANSFMDWVVRDHGNVTATNTMEEGNDQHGGYMVPDILEKYIIRALEGENVIHRLATWSGHISVTIRKPTDQRPLP